MSAEPNVIAISPCTASTKLGIFQDAQPIFVRNIPHTIEELAPCNADILSQFQYRLDSIDEELTASGYDLRAVSAVSGAGGLLRPLPSGTYRVNSDMLQELRSGEYGRHPKNLGAFLALALAARIGCEAFVVDPLSVDELSDVARVSGTHMFSRHAIANSLVAKYIARHFAKIAGHPVDRLRLIIACLGSETTISAHALGHMVDYNRFADEGPFSTDHAGSVPALPLIEMCFSGRYTIPEVEAMITREGGLLSYLGTCNLHEVEHRIAQGDSRADVVFRAMVYQAAKEIGAMACALQGRVDGILFSGELIGSPRFLHELKDAVHWIAPVHIYPQDVELQALAEGALRVLHHDEPVQEFGHEWMAAPIYA